MMFQKRGKQCLGGAGPELRASSWEKGTCQSQVLSGDLALLLASEDLPKKFVVFPPMSTSVFCQKCL